MKLAHRERMLSIAVILSAVVLVILGALQVRWSRQVSEAARARIGTSLKAAMLDWHLDLLREFSSPAIALSTAIDAGEPLPHYLEEYDEWTRGAPHPDLVADVFVLQRAPHTRPRLKRLNLDSGMVEPATWPAGMEQLRKLLQSPVQLAGVASAGPSPSHGLHRTNAPKEWLFDPHVPALLHAANCADPESNCVIIVLNRQVLEHVLLPELAQRYFGTTAGLEYQVAVLGNFASNDVIYSTDSDFDAQDFGEADARMDIFAPRKAVPAQAAGVESPGNVAPEVTMSSMQKTPLRNFAAPVWFNLVRYAPSDPDWYLIIKPRRGSLEDLVTNSRRRDLSISFGVLLLLAVSMLMVIITSHRAQNLARLQMEFISAVSHELRTPLAVMCSAADNLADGVVQGKQQLSQYRSIIASQARQLTQLVDQVLAFAATGEHKPQYDLRSLQVSQIIDATLEKTAGLIHDAQFEIEQDVQPDLPPVMGDVGALSQCLQNLIVNAVKYSGKSRWIGIRADLASSNGNQEVRISVADRGIGIKSSELDRIFHPFYRSPSVVGAQIHGTGLGLSLASSIADAMQGRLTVSSTPGEGSTFTLHLPAAPTASQQKAPEAVASPLSRS